MTTFGIAFYQSNLSTLRCSSEPFFYIYFKKGYLQQSPVYLDLCLKGTSQNNEFLFAGRYHCAPAKVRPATVNVHVLEGIVDV
jgi:hypothetical protein